MFLLDPGLDIFGVMAAKDAFAAGQGRQSIVRYWPGALSPTTTSWPTTKLAPMDLTRTFAAYP